MKQKFVSIFSWVLVLVLAAMLQTSFAEDKTIAITSVDDGGVISIYPDAFPVVRDLKGKVKGFTKDEIADLGLIIDILVNNVAQTPAPVEKNSKWKAKITIKEADLVIKVIVKDKSGKELAATSIKATASGEF
ncbi:MAG: hypothetical protein WC836_08455 [Desulfobacula sp.]|jgi:hypothetical protein